jgi:L-alanine-DL-glutamate epimerase-like enolase superfamily enzyme
VKITRIETRVVNLPMVIDGATPMLGGRARTSIDMLLVRVDTDAGVTGWGEAFGHRIFHATRAAIDTLLGPMCIGRDPGQLAALTDDLQRVLHGVGRGDFEDNPLGEAIQPRQGRIAVPQGPGLGVDPEPRLLERLRSSG